ncbi:armadillo-type protein [Phellopilus nigrolimitatus]|nr:armadillo-type protein [Phellopilus nigrolimitatus]
MDDEPKILTSFERLDETISTLNSLLSVSVAVDPTPEEDKTERAQLKSLSETLSEYQEQPYLLDPHLEQLVIPIVDAFRFHARAFTSDSAKIYSSARVHRLALILYSFVKLRGYFPHEVSDLSVAMDYMISDGPMKEVDGWALRYLVLLWLSLVCTLPFDLARFDSDGDCETATSLEDIAKIELNKPGMERDGAALMLSKLYMRKDTCTLLASFVDSFESEIHGSPRLFTCIGAMAVLAEVSKSAPLELLQVHLVRLQAIVNEVAQVNDLAENPVIRKLRSKTLSRLATRILPLNISRRRQTGKVINRNSPDDCLDEAEEEQQDVPPEVEDIFEELFGLLQDRDTSVRWSSAKGLSRISERLSTSFVNQVLDSILSLFTIHSSVGTLSELSAAAEHPWHGASLACAELARRNLIPEFRLPEVLEWMSKALFLDIRKGTFSVGSNVRDAAAYVIWSLARTRRKDVLKPHATDLAQKLVTVALFDREIHIRRAASAAFQENVGRMGLFPHGIAILAKTDFYSISIRRNAFLVAAPKVAAYEEYLQPILEHLLNVTLRHWDESMRRLGARSLRKICEYDMQKLGPQMVEQYSVLLLSIDTADVHGGLLALSELASAFREAGGNEKLEACLHKIFNLLDSVPSTMILSPRNHLITAAACYVVANAISPVDAKALQASAEDPFWRVIVAQGLRHRNGEVQEAAAAAMSSLNTMNTIFKSFFTGLDDYTVNERGDVGSWARLACVKGLCLSLESLIGEARDLPSPSKSEWSTTFPSFSRYLCPDTYHTAIGGILKQGVERLDNVRQSVGELFPLLLDLPQPAIEHGEEWTVQGKTLFVSLLRTADTPGWNDGSWLYPRAVRFLDVEITSSTQRPASSALLVYARSLPLIRTQESIYDLESLANNLLAIAEENPTSNNVVIPVLQAFNILLEGDVLLDLATAEEEICVVVLKKLLNLATKNVERLKSLQRVEESMKIDTAEAVYIVLQTRDLEYDEEVEENLLETEWCVLKIIAMYSFKLV